MSDFVIIPDASSDLTKDLRERFQIPDSSLLLFIWARKK